MSPKLSVIMAVYREDEDVLREAIRSVQKQTFMDFEFIIVLDDPDNIRLENLIKKIAKTDPRIIFAKNSENLGAHKARNRAISLSKTKILALMDADDISLPQRFEMQLNAMQKYGADIVASYVEVIDEQGRLIYKLDRLPKTSKEIKRKLKINDCMPHPVWMMKKEVYERLNGYNEVPYGCEDYEFLLRANKIGFRFYNVPNILLKYRMTKNSLSRKNLFNQYLLMCYFQDFYFRDKQSSTYQEYLDSHYTDEKANKYSLAANRFTNGVQKLSNRRFMLAMADLCGAFFVSKEYRDKMIRYLLQII